MAQVVIGIGTSHSPQLSIRAKDWDHLLKKDETDPRLDYPALLQKAKPGLASELTPEKFRERDEACLKAVKNLGDALQKANADIAVVFGDDQQEQFHDENMPMFAIYHGKSLPVVKDNKHRPSGWKDAERQGWAETAPEYETAQELANHLIRALVDAEFDITRCNKLREEIGVGHAFSFLYRRILPGGKLPMVPVMVNTYYPPNQPTPKRCYAFGQAVRKADRVMEQRQARGAHGIGRSEPRRHRRGDRRDGHRWPEEQEAGSVVPVAAPKTARRHLGDSQLGRVGGSHGRPRIEIL